MAAFLSVIVLLALFNLRMYSIFCLIFNFATTPNARFPVIRAAKRAGLISLLKILYFSLKGTLFMMQPFFVEEKISGMRVETASNLMHKITGKHN